MNKDIETRGRKITKYRLSLEFLRGEDIKIDEIIDRYNKDLIGYSEGLELIQELLENENKELLI